MKGFWEAFAVATIVSILSMVYNEIQTYENFHAFYAKVSAEYSHLVYLETLYLNQTPLFCVSGYQQAREYAIKSKEHYRSFLTYSQLYFNTMNRTYLRKAEYQYLLMHGYFTKASEIVGRMYEKSTGLLYDSFRTLDYIGADREEFPGRLRELYLELKEAHRKLQNFRQDKNYYWKIRDQKDLGAELVSAEYLLTQGSVSSLVWFYNKAMGKDSVVIKICNISREIDSEVNKFKNFLQVKKHEIQNRKSFLMQRISNIQDCGVYTEELVSFVMNNSEITSGKTEAPTFLCRKVKEGLKGIVLFTEFSGEDYLFNEYMTLRNYEEKLSEINRTIDQIVSDIQRTDRLCFARVEQLISEKEPSLLVSKALNYFKEAKENEDVLLCYKALQVLYYTNETDFSHEFMDLKKKQELLQKLGYNTEYCDFLLSMSEDIYYYGNYSDALDVFLEAKDCFSKLYSQFLSELSEAEKKAKAYYEIYKRMFPDGTIVYNDYTDVYDRYMEARRIIGVLYPIIKEELTNMLEEHTFVSYHLSEIPGCNEYYNITLGIIVANPFDASLRNVYLRVNTFYGEVPVYIDELRDTVTIYRKLFVKASSCDVSERLVYANQYFSIREVLVNVSSPFEYTCFDAEKLPENNLPVRGKCILLNPGSSLIYFNESSDIEYIRKMSGNKVYIRVRNSGARILNFEFIDPYINFSEANVNFTVSGNETRFILGTLESGEEREIIAEIGSKEEYLKSVIKYFYNHTNVSLEDSIKFRSLDDMSPRELEQFALDLEEKYLLEQREKKKLEEFSELINNTFLEIESWKEKIGYNPSYATVFFEIGVLIEKSKKCLQERNFTCVERSLKEVWDILDNISVDTEDFSKEIDFICDYRECTELQSLYERYLSGELSLDEFKRELKKEQGYVYQDFLSRVSEFNLQELLNDVKLAFGENSSQFREISKEVSTLSSKINNAKNDFFNSSPKEILLELEAFQEKVNNLVSYARYEAKYLLLKAREVFERSINKKDLTSYLKNALDNYNLGKYSLSGYYSKRLIELSEKGANSLPWAEILLTLGIIGFVIYVTKRPKKEKKLIEIVPGS